MNNFEVQNPIQNSPYEEPTKYWVIREGEPALLVEGSRREAGYFYRDPKAPVDTSEHSARGEWRELELVNLIRKKIKEWRAAGYPGATRTTLELLNYWVRDGKKQRLFFAQVEATEAVIFLKEARQDFLQGIVVPSDEPGTDALSKGHKAFQRYACKMATGSGKTTVMAMLAAWSILNKINSRGDARFSDLILIVCPNLTIKSRLEELNPMRDEASLYRTRDLVPKHLMQDLMKGRVLVTNWHVFEPQTSQVGGVSARVNKSGVRVKTTEQVKIGMKTTKARGSRYLTLEEFQRQVDAGMITVLEEKRDKQNNLEGVKIESERYVESETAMINRIIGREAGGKKNILVFNDEAHHAYRISRQDVDEEEVVDDEGEDESEFFKEATTWIEGLDKVNKLRGINFCVDLSATPYYLGRVGQAANTTFPWVISDFGLVDAIESGLVKLPQFAVRDTTGQPIADYFNLWQSILKKLTSQERGASKASPKPEAIVKYSHHPIAMLGGLWQETRQEWSTNQEDSRPPVFIMVCKNTRIAKVMFEWIAENKPPAGIPAALLEGFLNRDGEINTIRVDTKVIQETDSGEAKTDSSRWMRITLDTVGKQTWPVDSQGRSIYPDDFEALAKKLERPLHPPGKDIKCIISVGMLTEGWDCNTVTHIIGLRPFMSQLLCEQVVGRGLRRTSYDVDPETGLLSEEVAKIFGVPFEVIPFKANQAAASKPKPKRNHVHAIPENAGLEITFPRVTGYSAQIKNRISVAWKAIASLTLDPHSIPPEVQMKGLIHASVGRPSLLGPGKLEDVSLNPFRKGRRIQELEFEMAADLTREYSTQYQSLPAHILFPQLVKIVSRYLREYVKPIAPAELLDVFLTPYYGLVVERLKEAIKPDESEGEAYEVPLYEVNRGPGSSAEIDWWTSKDVREITKSHVNYVVADTKAWEQQAAYRIDTHPSVLTFVKNAGLGFGIPYFHNGQLHDYEPDFLIRFKDGSSRTLILETKGFDPLAEIKKQAAERWIAAVNADGKYGTWSYRMVRAVADVTTAISAVAAES
jgi:type III restriction enzyme